MTEYIIQEKSNRLFATASEENQQRLKFIVEMDKMKSINRHSLLINQSRTETDAEHSWQLAMMCMVFAPEAPEGTDIFRALKLCLIHDIVEIYAGDTYAYDTVGNETKYEREVASADRIYAILPEAEGESLKELWYEFERMETKEALYANAIDRLQPMILNAFSDGKNWVENEVTLDAVLLRAEPIRTGLPELWPMVHEMICKSFDRGLLL